MASEPGDRDLRGPASSAGAFDEIFFGMESLMSVVAVVGLGYVGLPLAVEFGKKGRTNG